MTERPHIVCILGNSVPLLIQPFRRNENEKTYSEHLRDRGFLVLNSAKQSVILSDLYHYLEDECIRHFPDYVIIDFGIVECTYRARTRWIQNFFSMNAWNNSIIRKGYNGPLHRGVKFAAKKIYKTLIERPFYALGMKRRWLNPRHFRFILRDIVKRVFSDTPVRKVIIMGMLKPSDWVERHAPGTRKSVAEYNAIMKSLAHEYPNIVFIDVQALFPPEMTPLMTQDGIHYSAEGHRLVSEKLLTLLQGSRVDYTGWQKINQYDRLYRLYENWFKR